MGQSSPRRGMDPDNPTCPANPDWGPATRMTLTPRDVRLILEATAKDLGSRGRDTQYGWGLVDPAKALAMVDERKRKRGTVQR